MSYRSCFYCVCASKSWHLEILDLQVATVSYRFSCAGCAGGWREAAAAPAPASVGKRWCAEGGGGGDGGVAERGRRRRRRRHVEGASRAERWRVASAAALAVMTCGASRGRKEVVAPPTLGWREQWDCDGARRQQRKEGGGARCQQRKEGGGSAIGA